MEEFVTKIQDEISVFDREYLRKIQGDMYRCSAKCCDDVVSSQNEFQRCTERCSQPALKADKFMQEQMQEIQDRFQRCVMSCADKIKDQTNLGDNSSQKNRAEMEGCVNKCGDEMIRLLPTFTKKMRDWFSQGYYLK